MRTAAHPKYLGKENHYETAEKQEKYIVKLGRECGIMSLAGRGGSFRRDSLCVGADMHLHV